MKFGLYLYKYIIYNKLILQLYMKFGLNFTMSVSKRVYTRVLKILFGY